MEIVPIQKRVERASITVVTEFDAGDVKWEGVQRGRFRQDQIGRHEENPSRGVDEPPNEPRTGHAIYPSPSPRHERHPIRPPSGILRIRHDDLVTLAGSEGWHVMLPSSLSSTLLPMVNRLLVRLSVVCAIALFSSGTTARAQDADEANPLFVQALSRAHVTLSAALSSVKPPAVPISAKYELDGRGTLSLSISIATHGARSGNHDFMKELSGNPLVAAWSPATETLKDMSDVSVGVTERRLMATTNLTLIGIARQAITDQPGTVLSINPWVVAGKPQFVVKVLGPNSQIAKMAYDLKTGSRLR